MPVVPGATPWNPSLHPRQGGGRFGQSSNTTAVNQEGKLKQELHERAGDYRKRAAAIEDQIKSIHVQIQSLRPSSTHSHTAHNVKAKSAKGAKSGVSKKTTVTKKSVKAAASSASSNAQKITQLQGKIVVLRGEQRALLKDATKMDEQAAKL